MSNPQMKSKIQEIRSKLTNTNYDNFAHKNSRRGNPDKWTDSFLELLKELEQLVRSASNKFLHAPEILFREGKELLDVKKRAVSRNDFEKGKDVLSEVLRIIEQNLQEEKSIKNPNPDPSNSGEAPMIFVSYESQQILKEIQTVISRGSKLATFDSKLATVQISERSQSKGLDNLTPRIDEIHKCTCAIICLPTQNSPEASSNLIAYFDLGACLALFPEKILLIHQGEELTDNLTRVKTFEYFAPFDFDRGMELLGEIGEIL